MNTLELACLIASFEVAAGRKRCAKATIQRATRDKQGLVIAHDGSTWFSPVVLLLPPASADIEGDT